MGRVVRIMLEKVTAIARLQNVGRPVFAALFGSRPRRNRCPASKCSLVIVGACWIAGIPAFAQGTTASAETEALARYNSIIELEKAQAELAQQRLKTLGLATDTKGETKLGEKGGEFEGWLLSALAINKAADALLLKIKDHKSLVLLAGDEKFDMGLAAAMQARLDYLLAQSNQLSANYCRQPGRPTPSAFIGGAAPYIGSLLSAFRTDTTITGVGGPSDARLIIAALGAMSLPADAKWIVPSEMIGPPSGSLLLQTWQSIENRRSTLSDCRAALAAQGDSKKAPLAAVDAQLKAIDDFATKQVGAGEVVSPLIQAARGEQIAKLKPKVVRIHVEKAGGSILLRRNLFTMLGAPAVGITGGAIVGWRLIDPEFGQLLGGGNLICRTELSNMRAIHRGKVAPSDCEWRLQ